MPIDKWPCIPDTFDSTLPGDLPSFLQTGATHSLGRPVSIIDPKSKTRIDAIERFDGYQIFCRYLRGGCVDPEIESSWDESCTRFDLIVAEHLIDSFACKREEPPTATRYRCYMGCEEIATVIWVGGHGVMVVSGQHCPLEGPGDIRATIPCLGKRSPAPHEITSAMADSISKFEIPEDLWTMGSATEEDRQRLLEYSLELLPMRDGFADRFLREAKRIADIGQSYYEMAKAKVEAEIMQDIARIASETTCNNSSNLWKRLDQPFEVLRTGLNLEYVAFFFGEDEADTILRLRSSVRENRPEIDRDKIAHFNWRKAGLKTADWRDTHEQTYDWSAIDMGNWDVVLRGFRGGDNPFSKASAMIPFRLHGGPLGLLILGPHNHKINLRKYSDFILSACRDLGTRILTKQLAEILARDRSDWEKTAKLTGHRVRASIQSIESQLSTIEAYQRGEPEFTALHRDLAGEELSRAFTALKEVSYAAESSVPGAVDARIATRESIDLGSILLEAVEAQQELADEHGIRIDVSERVGKLPNVFANRALLKYVFINLINNGLKYSYPRPETRDRFLSIDAPEERNREFGKTEISISNFGLGVRDKDLAKIFEWGVRLAKAHEAFRETYGKGIGLWECKHIVEGHGGQIWVESAHYSGSAVTDYNTDKCVTVFKVSLPLG